MKKLQSLGLFCLFLLLGLWMVSCVPVTALQQETSFSPFLSGQGGSTAEEGIKMYGGAGKNGFCQVTSGTPTEMITRDFGWVPAYLSEVYRDPTDV